MQLKLPKFRKVICRVTRQMPTLGQLVGVCLSGSARFEVLHDISVALAFVVVPRTGFGGSAGCTGALVVTGSISSVQPENANHQHSYYLHITDQCCSGLTERPLQMLGGTHRGRLYQWHS